MADFHTIRIKEVKKETADTVSIALDVPNQLKKLFSYTQGQYLTIKKKLNGEEVRRSYSLCSSPHHDEDWRIAIKTVQGGLFSSFANEYLSVGDILEVMPPEGKFFTELKEGQKKNYIAFAAGSGITPIMSILKSTLTIEKESTFTLYYGNRNPDSVIFKDELENLVSEFSGRLIVHLIYSKVSGQGTFDGRISADKCDEFSALNSAMYSADEYFLCGPEEMIFSVKEKLESNKVDKSQIHFELFNTPVEAADHKTSIPSLESEVTVMIDGEEHIFNLSSKGSSILDAAMDAGADVPFSCKGAVCCTCRAKLVEGTAMMALNYSLTDKEVEDGYILTCQAHPTSEKVLVDYDQD